MLKEIASVKIKEKETYKKMFVESDSDDESTQLSTNKENSE